MAFAVALDSPEQYVGGSAGGSSITLPTALAANSAFGAVSSATSNSELNSGGTTLNVPNYSPDVIVKAAFDPTSRVHAEVGGLWREFRVWDPLNGTTNTASGAGFFFNFAFEPIKGFRLLTNNFYSDGGGRYIFGQAPDLIVHADGTLSAIHASSTVSGVEWTHKNTLLYSYYGGLYVAKNLAFDANGTSLIGYGLPNNTGQNRAVQEVTAGFNQTIWRDAKYGAVNLMGQYSYVVRNPWSFPSLQPEDAHLNMIFVNLRYTLPGGAPSNAALGLK
jgi:hypothetical protein